MASTPMEERSGERRRRTMESIGMYIVRRSWDVSGWTWSKEQRQFLMFDLNTTDQANVQT